MNHFIPTFTEALDEAQLNPTELNPLEDDIDSNGEIIKRWDNTEHGEYIIIQHYTDGYLTIHGKQRDYFEGHVDGDLHEEA